MLLRDGARRDPNESRELKVKVPLNVHVHLHSLKILTGKSISEVVTEALGEYFDEMEATDRRLAERMERSSAQARGPTIDNH